MHALPSSEGSGRGAVCDERPGVYAVETVLDGDEYAELSTYLLRFDG